MTSKVNLQIRNAIIAFLQPGTTATNNGLKFHVVPSVSLRAVQEATQKLAREGVLEMTKSNGKTWYGIPNAPKIVGDPAGASKVYIGLAPEPKKQFHVEFELGFGAKRWVLSNNKGLNVDFDSAEEAEKAIALSATKGFGYKVVEGPRSAKF